MKIINFVSWLTLAIAITMILGAMVWLYYPYRTIDIEEPVKILNSPVEAGKYLQYEVSYCKYTKKPGVVHWVVKNDVIVHLSEITSVAPLGCDTVVLNTVKIPEQLPSGNYTAEATIVYKVNPLREIHKTFVTEEFKIINDTYE